MVALNLKINSNITVLWQGTPYKASIQDIRENEILINVPINDMKLLILGIGDEIEQYFCDDSSSYYNYKSKVLGKYIENKMFFYRLSKPYEVKKIQRRGYYRVSIIKNITYIKQEDKKIDGYKTALLLDLSGGGMRAKMDEYLSLDEIIILNISYDNEVVTVKGKIVRRQNTEDNKYIYGINFYEIDDITQENIIKIVFKIMRKQRSLL